MAHLCRAPDQTERLWRRRRKRRIDGGRGWRGWRKEAARGRRWRWRRRRRRDGQQPNKLLINKELPGCLSWVLQVRHILRLAPVIPASQGRGSRAAIVGRGNKRNSIYQPCYYISHSPRERLWKNERVVFRTADFQHDEKRLIHGVPTREILLKSNWLRDCFLKESALFMKITAFALLWL